MILDFLGARTLLWGTILFSLIFLFLPFQQRIKLLFFGTLLYFLIFFALCSYWAKEYYSDLKFVIGFLVSFAHTFFFFLSGTFGLAISSLLLKFSPFLLPYLREMFSF
jgi:hypothetical protein